MFNILAASLLKSATMMAAFTGITNRSIDPAYGGDPAKAADGSIFVTYFINVWNSVMVIGGLIVLFFYIQAGIEWITAGGDSGKIQKARDRMIQSTIGLFILVSSFIIINFVSSLLFKGTGFNIMNLTLPGAR
ncbi:hypothetical protein KA012_00070 [Candidatus Woesebacteria bacterium]|nr:hypothetical protein [Candidatus Woesebacteria bacterium]